ncbi:MAG: ABC-type transport auxiliary lipoprotein family protein [Gammaproteobacteria bacterium]|nr:ABC-type transport auxiliary lipoprotein family protein [Gammaproteobacteria bacterium]
MNRRVRCGVVLLLLLLLLSACSPSLLMQKTPPVSRYLLEWTDTQAVPAKAGGLSLRLSSITSAPGFDEPRIVYVRTPSQLEYYLYHRWVDAPARMLEPLLMRMLEQSGLFRAVVGADTPVRADLELRVELLQLQQLFTPEGSEVQLSVNINLLNPAEARLIASRLFSMVEPVAEPTPYGSVQAANRATARLLVAIRSFLGDHQSGFIVPPGSAFDFGMARP